MTRDQLFASPVRSTSTRPTRSGGQRAVAPAPTNPPSPRRPPQGPRAGPAVRPQRARAARRRTPVLYTYGQVRTLFEQATRLQRFRVLHPAHTRPYHRMLLTLMRNKMALEDTPTFRESGFYSHAQNDPFVVPMAFERRFFTFHRRLNGILTAISHTIPLDQIPIESIVPLPRDPRRGPSPVARGLRRRFSPAMRPESTGWVDAVPSRTVSPRSTPNAHIDPVTFDPISRGIRLECGIPCQRHGHWLDKNTFRRIAKGPAAGRKCPLCRVPIRRQNYAR